MTEFSNNIKMGNHPQYGNLMKRITYSIVLIVICCSLSAQNSTSKQLIDSSCIGKWPSLGGLPIISYNGVFSAFTIKNLPFQKNTVVLKRNDNSWEKHIVTNSVISDANMFFSKNSQHFIWLNSDTLFIYSISEDKLVKKYPINTLKVPIQDKGGWAAFKFKSGQSELVLLNLITMEEIEIADVNEYHFDNQGHALITVIKNGNEVSDTVKVKMFDLVKASSRIVWSDISSLKKRVDVNSFSFDNFSNQLSFVASESIENGVNNSVWYFQYEDNNARLLVNNNSFGLENKFKVSQFASPQFSSNGKWILFYLNVPAGIKTGNAEKPTVEIWSYKDILLQPEKSRISGDIKKKLFSAAVSVNGGHVVKLEQEDESNLISPSEITGNYVVIKTNIRTPYWWPHSSTSKIYLLSLTSGKRELLSKTEGYLLNGFSFSPGGQYLSYWDAYVKKYYCHDFKTGKNIDISKEISNKFISNYQNRVSIKPVSFFPAGWLNNDEAIILYDNYDIWKVDPLGIFKPVNLTNSYGFRNKIKFRFSDEEANHLRRKYCYSNNDTILLLAFDDKTKYTGFYRISTLGAPKDPEYLTMGPYSYNKTVSQIGGQLFSFYGNNMEPIKAMNSEAWVVKRSSATEAPNYYFTKDFRRYVPLSALYPNKSFNWLTSELITWKSTDGTTLQGVLYKPENFDSKRKYPVIYNYYERLSHCIYEFPYPAYTGDNINIPWFVSNGYLVFTPDISYKTGVKSNKPIGEWAYNSVTSAAKHLAKFTFIDSSKMAIQGHSFGGMETGYIVTHSKLFAAAFEAAGSMDPISRYLTLIPLWNTVEHQSVQESMETQHEMYGATPWEKPDLYLKNSAVLNADKVTAPLLIMHNKRDNQVQWRQGVEMYMAMRRLGKKCWMLQYDESGHGAEGNDQIDFTIRLTQYFNHYLKDSLPPKWMTQVTSVESKGIESSYDLDPNNSCGSNCVICKKRHPNNFKKIKTD